MTEKPPIGIEPRHQFETGVDRERARALIEAIHRYAVAGHPVPRAWLDELSAKLEIKE